MKSFIILLSCLYSLSIFASCRNLSVVVRLGDRPNCYQGHAGLAVDGEYYDWGPTTDKNWQVFTIGSRGRPYEDLNQVPKNRKDRKEFATLSDIRNFYKHGANECAAYEFSGKITPEEAKIITDYWEWIYNVKKPYFHYFFASQCTKTLCRSLKAAGVIEKVLLKPKTLYKYLDEGLITSTCGQQYKIRFKKTQLHM
jgi:hypothetical protein